ncbi:TlyA family RNA methyltransferase [Anaerolineales bacterium]
MTEKQRLDLLLYQKGLAESREKARAMIMAAEIKVNGQLIDKPGTKVALDAEIMLKVKPRFVSRGGEKLAGALKDFNYDVAGKICADVGASTGGFTDCLLKNQAQRVYSIDVGYGQLAHSLRIDPKVVVMERTNARYLESLEEEVDLIVADASFISLTLLLPAMIKWLKKDADIIALIKPQFEAGKADVGKGGVVRNHEIHQRVVLDIAEFAETQSLYIQNLTISPIKGPKGNIEFLIWLSKSIDKNAIHIQEKIEELIASIS